MKSFLIVALCFTYVVCETINAKEDDDKNVEKRGILNSGYGYGNSALGGYSGGLGYGGYSGIGGGYSGIGGGYSGIGGYTGGVGLGSYVSPHSYGGYAAPVYSGSIGGIGGYGGYNGYSNYNGYGGYTSGGYSSGGYPYSKSVYSPYNRIGGYSSGYVNPIQSYPYGGVGVGYYH